MLEVRNIAFSYGKKSILKDVSFVASPGEVVSIVGANGAGKTTLLKILATLLAADSGQLLSDGLDAFERPLRYRRQIGYLPETPALYEDMSVKEYLTYRALLKGEPAKRVRRRVGEAAELCHVSNILRSSVRTLSNGLKRRVALADAIILRPRVLLLDDYLAGLDTSFRTDAGEILTAAASFSPVILTGHELRDLAKFTTRFLVLSGGSIVSTVTAAGLDVAEIEERVREALEGGKA